MEEQEYKFKILKARLAAMGYKHPFPKQSAALVEALLNDFARLNLSLSKSRKQTIDGGRVDALENAENLQNQLESEIISDFRKENAALYQKLQAQRDGSADKTQEYVEKLFDECSFLKKQLEDYEGNMQKIVNENSNLQDRLKSSESHVKTLKSELDLTLITIKDISSENRSTNEEFYSLKQIISSYESKFVLLNSQADGLRLEVQKLLQGNRNYENDIGRLNKEHIKYQNENEVLTSARVRLTSEIEIIQRQYHILDMEKQKLQMSCLDEKAQNLKLTESYKHLEAEHDETLEKMRAINRECNELRNQIREKEEFSRNSSGVQKTIEKELKETKIFIGKFEDSQKENKKLKEISEDAIFELKNLNQKLYDAQATLKFKEEDIRKLKGYLDQANKENENLKIKVQDEVLKAEGFSMCQRNNSFLEEQLMKYKMQSDDFTLKERQLYLEIDQLRNLLKKSGEKLQFATKQCERINGQKLSVEEDNTKMQRSLAECMDREKAKTLEICKIDSKMQESHLEVKDLHAQVQKYMDDLLATQDQLKISDDNLNNEKNYVLQQNEQISRLKEYNTSLEDIRNDYLKKIENLKVIEIDHANVIRKMSEEISMMKSQLGQSEKVHYRETAERETLQSQVHSLKSEIGRKNDEISALNNSLRVYMEETDDIKSQCRTLMESEQNFKRKWRDSDIENSRLIEINRALSLQAEDNSKISCKLQVQVQNISKELEFYTEKCKTTGFEKEMLSNKAEENNKELQNKIATLSILSREKEDLQIKYRLLSEDFDKLERAYEHLIEKVEEIERVNKSLNANEEVNLRTIQELEEELQRAIRVVELADYKRIEAERTSEELFHNMHSAKSLTKDLDLNCESLEHKLQAVESEKNFFETRFRAVEHELFQVKSELEYEKQKISGIESKSMRNRDSSFKEVDEERLKIFRSSNPNLVSELYKQIDGYKSENLKLEMDYMKVMDELNKSKTQLHQTQIRMTDLEISRR